MEQTKIYQALMTLFENEEKWFSENVELHIEPYYYGCEDYECKLQDALDKCHNVDEQITFADKHWALIYKSIEGSQWAQAYNALIELRVLSGRPENPIKKKRIVKRKRSETTCE